MIAQDIEKVLLSEEEIENRCVELAHQIEKDYKESSPHLSVKKCVEKNKKWGNRLIISHLCPAYTDDEIMNEAGIGDKWEIAEERKEYVL